VFPVDDIEAQLRGALAAAMKGGRTGYAIAKAAGLKPEILYRFTRGDDLRLRSAAKLATVLELTLTPIPVGENQEKPEPKTARRKKK
jgi:hypothetical protein